MKTYSIIKRLYGEEINQVNVGSYKTKEDATNAGNSWEIDCTIHAELRKGRNFEVVENELIATVNFELNVQGKNGDNRSYTGDSKKEALRKFKIKYPYKISNVSSKYWEL
jgi:hypothetical protein